MWLMIDLDAERDLVLLLGDEEAVALLDGDTVSVGLSAFALPLLSCPLRSTGIRFSQSGRARAFLSIPRPYFPR